MLYVMSYQDESISEEQIEEDIAVKALVAVIMNFASDGI